MTPQKQRRKAKAPSKPTQAEVTVVACVDCGWGELGYALDENKRCRECHRSFADPISTLERLMEQAFEAKYKFEQANREYHVERQKVKARLLGGPGR